MADDPKLSPGTSFRESLSHEIEERLAKRTAGRRRWDGVRQGSLLALVVATLLHGGFVYVTRDLMQMGERQLDRERAMLIQQHQELLAAVKELTTAMREQSAVCRVAPVPVKP